MSRPADDSRSQGLPSQGADLLRWMLEGCPDPVFAVDAEGRLLAFNPAFAAALVPAGGRPPTVGGPAFPSLDPDLSARWSAAFGRALAGETLVLPSPQRLSGDPGAVELRLAPLRDGAGRTVGVLVVSRDRSEAPPAGRSPAPDDRFQQLFQGLPVGVVYQDASGRITSANPAAARILGVPLEQLPGRASLDPAGKAIQEDGAEFPGEAHPALLALRTRRPVLGQIIGVFHPGRGRHVWLRVDSVPLFRLGEAEPASVVTSLEDVTEVLLAERRARDLYNRTPAMLHSIDADGRIVAVSDTWLSAMGYTRTEVLGHRSTEFLTEASRRHAREVVLPEFYRTGSCRNVEYQWVRKDGEVLDGLLSAVAERDPSGRFLRSLAVITDVSERRRVEQALLHAQKLEAVGRLAGGVAHDFNNILSAISGYAGLLQLEMRPDDPHRVEVDEIAAAASRATHLTRGLLAFSRRQVMQRQRLDLNAVVGGAEGLLRRVVSEDVALETRLSAEPLPVYADATQLQQVLVSLVGFARDRMTRGGRIALSTVRADLDPASAEHIDDGMPGHYAVLTVRDSGPDVDEATRARIFEPAFDAVGGTSGTGLGLSIAYGIVRQHGGLMGVDGGAGQGCSFRIYLPLVAGGVPAAAPAVPEASRRPDGGRETILVAEDEPLVRRLVESFLRKSGYDVVVAVDGQDAVDRFRERADDIRLVLMDVIMPRMSGRAAWEHIRRIRPGVKVLFTSGYTAEIIRDRGELDEDAELLMKPHDLFALGRKIRSMLDAT
jgi:two-component system, cell cycle sensor histidine kinase and response regulator CckA